MNPADRLVGIAYVALSATSFAATVILASLAYRAGVEVPALLFLRFTIAGALLSAVMAVRRERWPRGRTLAALVALGAVGYGAQSLAFFTALRYATAGLASLLLYLFPAVVALLSVVFLGERLTRVRVLALVLALAGSALTVGSGIGGQPLGVALGVAAAVLTGCFLVLSSGVAATAGPVATAAVLMGSAAPVYAVAVALGQPALPTGVAGVAAVAGHAAATVVAVVALFAGMARLGPADTATLSTLEPVVTVALAATVLSEPVVAVQLVGGALILAAVVLLARTRPAGLP